MAAERHGPVKEFRVVPSDFLGQAFTGGVSDEVAGGCEPVMCQIAPFARDSVRYSLNSNYICIGIGLSHLISLSSNYFPFLAEIGEHILRVRGAGWVSFLALTRMTSLGLSPLVAAATALPVVFVTFWQPIVIQNALQGSYGADMRNVQAWADPSEF